MSKKIKLILSNKERPNLISLFKSYVKRRVSEEAEKYKRYGRAYPNYMYDDEYAQSMAMLRHFYGNYWDDDDDDCYCDYTDYEVEDDGTIVFPPAKENNLNDTLRSEGHTKPKGKHKHTKHRSRGKNNIGEPYNANFIDENGDIIKDNIIYYYPDYHDKYDRLEFNSLIEFDEYCNEEGFVVPPYVGEMIAYSPVSHCCLRPEAKDIGILEIMREDTYGDMFYEACETSELSV